MKYIKGIDNKNYDPNFTYLFKEKNIFSKELILFFLTNFLIFPTPSEGRGFHFHPHHSSHSIEHHSTTKQHIDFTSSNIKHNLKKDNSTLLNSYIYFFYIHNITKNLNHSKEETNTKQIEKILQYFFDEVISDKIGNNNISYKNFIKTSQNLGIYKINNEEIINKFFYYLHQIFKHQQISKEETNKINNLIMYNLKLKNFINIILNTDNNYIKDMLNKQQISNQLINSFKKQIKENPKILDMFLNKSQKNQFIERLNNYSNIDFETGFNIN